MVASANLNLAQTGIYTVDEAARLARVGSTMMRRWVDGQGDRRAALSRHMPESPSSVVSFVDYIQTKTVRLLRLGQEVEHPDKPGETIFVKPSLQQIRQAVDEAKRCGFPYPFARQVKTYLFRDDIVIDPGNDPENDNLITLTGKYRGQHLLGRRLVNPYLLDLTFGEDGLVRSDRPFTYGDRTILIDPSIKYGTPIVAECGVSVSALTQAYDQEGDIHRVADMYEVDVKDVIIALKYDDLLSGITR